MKLFQEEEFNIKYPAESPERKYTLRAKRFNLAVVNTSE
jgi:hypothetical protein